MTEKKEEATDNAIEGKLIEFADNGALMFLKDKYTAREYLIMSRYAINSDNDWETVRSHLTKIIEQDETQLQGEVAA